MDILRAELERLFSLDELKKLSSDLLGLDPEDVGGTAAKGAFARALVDRCAREDALEALADAVLLSSQQVDPRVHDVYVRRPGADLAPGANVGPYRVVKKLGEGGIGTVYLAERGEDGASQRVALKLVRPEHARDRASVRRFATALRALRALKHDAIAPVLDVAILEDGRPYVASSYLDGQTVASRVARTGPFHYNEARPIVLSMLSGLDALHRRGLVHGDVKAENVFIVRHEGREPTAVLVDFGADRLLTRGAITVEHTGPLPVFGTPKSLAPEQARGARADARSDVYAAGVMLYELLAGRPPFVGASAIDIVAQHLVNDPPPPSQHAPRGWVAKELDDVVLKALAKDPASRYGAAGDLRDALDSLGRARVRTGKPKQELDPKELEAAVALLEEAPGDHERATSVEQVVEPADAWASAIEAFEKVAGKSEDKEVKKSLLFRVARIQEHELGDGASSEATLAKILEIDPDDDVAEQALIERKRGAGKHEDVIEILIASVERESDPRDRARTLREIARVYDQDLNRQDNAFLALVQALADVPTDRELAGEVEQLAKTTEQWNEALSALAAAVESQEAVEAKVSLYGLMGRWYDQHLKRPDFAVSCYSQALALDPANDAALGGTADVYRRAQQWRELGATLLRRADSASDPARARDMRAEAAEILLSKLSDPVQAETMARRVLEDDPGHGRACDVLEQVLSAKNAWEEVVELLEARSKSEHGATRLETLAHIAELAEDRLQDAAKAIDRYEAVLAEDEDNLVALKGLDRLYSREGKYKELLRNLRKQTDLAATPRQRITLLERMAAIHHEEFVDPTGAAELYEHVLEIDPDHDGGMSALGRLYRELQRFDDLADILDRHAKATDDAPRKVDILMQLGRVLSQDIGAPERALRVYERVLAVDPQHGPALEAVAASKAHAGDAQAALAALEKLIASSKDPQSKSDLLLRAGKVLEDQGDRDGAIERYKAALDVHSQNTSAAASLRAIYAARGDAHGAAEMILREIDVAAGASAKSKLYGELGAIYRDRLKEPLSAKEAFGKAVDLDSTNSVAARSLADIQFDAGNYEEAAKLFEPLLGKVDAFSKDELRSIAIRTGDAFRKSGSNDRALRAYLNAKGFAPNDREALERLAELTFESGEPEEAREHYKEIVLRFGSQLTGPERGRILYRLGESARRANEIGAAIGPLTEAAELLSADPEPLASLRKIYESQGKWDEVVRTLRRRMEHAGDDERYALLVECGDLLIQKLSDKQRAIKSYAAALEIKGDDRNLLGKLMQVYTDVQDWSRLVEVVLRIAELVTDPRALAKYYVTAASISQQQMNRSTDAVDYYNQALDQDPSLLKAFDGIVEILTSKTDWGGLDEAYRRQIKRLGDGAAPDIRAHLWDSLAEVLHRRLHRTTDAIEAYEHAATAAPDDRRRLETLADLYAAEPKRYGDKAIKSHESILKKSPYRLDSYKALRRVYTELKNPDASWCVCQALRALNMAETDEEAFFKKHRSMKPITPKDRVTEELWASNLVHADQEPLLTAIFATITPAVVATSQPVAAFGLGAGDKVDIAKDKAPLAQAFLLAQLTLGITVPEVYNQKGEAGGATFVFSRPPAIGLGQAAQKALPAPALGFVAGRHLSFFRPGHYPRQLVPTGTGLRAWLLAALKMGNPQMPLPNDLRGTVSENLESIRAHLTAPALDQLRSLVQKLVTQA
ncbi:MAG: protein kinase, partial [Deltaproteobacteria bacterium]|nr:protein kinase [Deltaproteobacteria bacterium]